MRLLALDTTTAACAVAASGSDDAPPLVLTRVVDRAHGEHLLGLVDEVMAETGWRFPDLDRIAATVGPGSFTGVRIGVAAARGLALVTGAALVGVGNLDVVAAMARDKAGEGPVLATLQAGRGKVYVQLVPAGGEPPDTPRVVALDEAAALATDGVRVAGSAARDVLAAAGRADPPVHEEATPDMGVVCALARLTTPTTALTPLYLRPPDAKPQSGGRIARQ